jgi:DNA-binding winged helix-turn-helix (wHTH) protein
LDFVGISPPIAFGSFYLDVGTRQLLRGPARRVVHLTPKAFALLCALVEARPRVVAKSELHTRLWPSTFVSEATLSTLIAELRKALGEDRQKNGFIQTRHGFGYAFVAAHDERESKAPQSTNWIVFDGRERRLDEGEHVLGRGTDVAIQLGSPSVSRRHAKLVIARLGATIEDLQSKNGVYLGGLRISAATCLTDGDRIRVGGIEVVFRCTAEGGSTVTAG